MYAYATLSKEVLLESAFAMHPITLLCCVWVHVCIQIYLYMCFSHLGWLIISLNKGAYATGAVPSKKRLCESAFGMGVVTLLCLCVGCMYVFESICTCAMSREKRMCSV